MIKCQECHLYLKDEDRVVLDIGNGLTHHDCFLGKASTIKDFSSYSNIVNNYSIFADVKSPSH